MPKTLACRCPAHRHALHCIVPPYMLEHLAAAQDAGVRHAAIAAIEASADARATRRTMCQMPGLAAFAAPAGRKHRLVYDASGLPVSRLPGDCLARAEGQPATGDAAVDEAYEHSGTTHDFYLRRFERRSLDNRGMTLVSSVHVGFRLNNAFWNGQQMAYGDGDGEAFGRFTQALDVVAHELTHGVIAHECNLAYQGESGALNEHFADVFGLLVKQWKLKQNADQADWLVGADVLGPAVGARALRDMGPDRAYEDDPLLGTDPQPKHRDAQYDGTADSGGVHINSGIPNHAFYRFAKALGGPAWKLPGGIWYEAMRKLSSDSSFTDMVATTAMIAAARHGEGSRVHRALLQAWRDVGL